DQIFKPQSWLLWSRVDHEPKWSRPGAGEFKDLGVLSDGPITPKEAIGALQQPLGQFQLELGPLVGPAVFRPFFNKGNHCPTTTFVGRDALDLHRVFRGVYQISA